MFTISGQFINGERYYNDFNNRYELEYNADMIYKNDACEVPDKIIGKKPPAKLPRYLTEFMRQHEIKYVYDGD